MPAVFGIVLDDGKQLGDYAARYADSLFIFVDTFIDLIRLDARSVGGSACLRKTCVQKMKPQDLASGLPKSAGIPTGWSTETGGFPELDKCIRKAIDLAFVRINFLINKHNYDKIIYSADPEDDSLINCRIFADTIHEEVVRYISMKLHGITDEKPTRQTLESVQEAEYTLARFAFLVDGVARRDKEIAKLQKKIAKQQEEMMHLTFSLSKQEDKEKPDHKRQEPSSPVPQARKDKKVQRLVECGEES